MSDRYKSRGRKERTPEQLKVLEMAREKARLVIAERTKIKREMEEPPPEPDAEPNNTDQEPGDERRESAEDDRRSAEDQEQGERCNVDADCASDAPYCSVSGYCLACLEDAHCPAQRSCTNGYCLADVCTPNETMCSGDTLLTCDAQGAAWDEMACPGSAGQCVDGACTGCDPGYTACIGKDQRVV